MNADGAGWPKGQETKCAIAELANAMQTAIGWVGAMDLEELRALSDKLAIMHRVVVDRLADVEHSREVHP